MVLAQEQNMDQWNRIESSEIIYGQLIFSKHTKRINWDKGQPFQQIVLGNLDIHMQNNEIGSLSYTMYKN